MLFQAETLCGACSVAPTIPDALARTLLALLRSGENESFNLRIGQRGVRLYKVGGVSQIAVNDFGAGLGVAAFTYKPVGICPFDILSGTSDVSAPCPNVFDLDLVGNSKTLVSVGVGADGVVQNVAVETSIERPNSLDLVGLNASLKSFQGVPERLDLPKSTHAVAVLRELVCVVGAIHQVGIEERFRNDVRVTLDNFARFGLAHEPTKVIDKRGLGMCVVVVVLDGRGGLSVEDDIVVSHCEFLSLWVALRPL